MTLSELVLDELRARGEANGNVLADRLRARRDLTRWQRFCIWAGRIPYPELRELESMGLLGHRWVATAIKDERGQPLRLKYWRATGR